MSFKMTLLDLCFLCTIYKLGESTVNQLAELLSSSEELTVTSKQVLALGNKLKMKEYVVSKRNQGSNHIAYSLTEKGVAARNAALTYLYARI